MTHQIARLVLISQWFARLLAEISFDAQFTKLHKPLPTIACDIDRTSNKSVNMTNDNREQNDIPWKFEVSSMPKSRLGQSPDELGVTVGGGNCPDIWEMTSGDIMVIGTDITQRYADKLPDGCSRGEHEAIIAIPRRTFRSAVKSFTT